MYAAIVRRKVIATFAELSTGVPDGMIATMAPRFTYRFVGDNALGGVRTTTVELEQWWRRVFTLFPGARFDVRRVAVSGLPSNTTVATHVTISCTRADGVEYSNEFMQFMTLKWGRATDVVTLEDTARLAGALGELDAAGFDQAMAAPIGRTA